ncbi:type II CRISPR-associated endonuclease Cas1 [Flavobacterium columnare NBRC 100251 = ATCC 23463]|uniref:CRISPR-associated endonuclease Cas1 n=2 Tax=Flavobacterium columnare TaxID=996 RepID=G8XA15_FLACA|nr:type II CRISPR-associated endonuclease Cas1 [Flavobacterium columnare]AEW85179.1 CRISPR-associated protein Cas1 [Flavobacterium columnare ATCC 49512]AMO19553.1 type II CRISPR-associated endonuclease Cas1 [Flavobacterium columnare]AUX17491.1 type II CRISPR-associated endonuclease Cas1 [Flavobacterium columnare]MBF6653466.1 type II CRISPR-associated endonuclease Cas1 [Flavobacterium columnare]MBF6656093.1 type II CRISPR-associated endonuclease Cas1 [Flavobacterium columnare]
MLKKTILIENKSSLYTKNNQLIIKGILREATIPIEDIGFLVLESQEIYISLPALNLLLEHNSAVIICNASHLPQGMFLNLNSHHIQQELFKYQIEASIPLKKQLWQQTIVEKITNQGLLLERITGLKNQFPFLASKVLSGDSSNMEGVAASQYWKQFFDIRFKRERFGDYPNNFLNYGYTLLRAATARSLSGSGLLNTLGIHHRNKYNAFALADDIMEPFRPLVDEKVYELIQRYEEQELNTAIKSELLQILTRTVYFKDEKSPLMVGLQKTASSLQQCFSGDRKKIKYPKLWI